MSRFASTLLLAALLFIVTTLVNAVFDNVPAEQAGLLVSKLVFGEHRDPPWPGCKEFNPEGTPKN